MQTQILKIDKEKARKILDSVKRGEAVPVVTVTAALYALGDVTEEPLGLYERSKTAPESFLGEFRTFVSQA